MNRRTFLFRSFGLALAVYSAPAISPLRAASLSGDPLERIALGTLLFRYRFKQTKPKELPVIKDELTLLDVPGFYRDRFGIRKIEFWNEHFESLKPSYLKLIKSKIKAAGSELVNVQIDRISYDLASPDEAVRLKSLKDVKEWIDAVSFLESKFIRINPGRQSGSVEKSIKSLKELGAYARVKNLKIITANHFGIEMDPGKHVQIVKGAGENVYTEPDFGNYPHDSALLDKLKKIIPYAGVVSAKVCDFNGELKHISYDFDACVRLCETLGFKGVYMAAQWSGTFQNIDYSKVADWVIAHLKQNIRA